MLRAFGSRAREGMSFVGDGLRQWVRLGSRGPGRLLHSAFTRARRSRKVARSIFGIRFAPLAGADYYFDITTVALFRRLSRSLSAEARLLDMGTGAVAVLGISLWKRLGCRVISSDVNPALVESARKNVALNAAPIEVVCARFFDGIGDDFDVVCFNPPYVASETGDRRQLSERRSQWDGGDEGTSVIDEYLRALTTLRRPVVSYLGMNHLHVGREQMQAVLDRHRHVKVEEIHRDRALPVDIYTLSYAPSAA